MSNAVYRIIRNLPLRILSWWVKPQVLPESPGSLIDPNLPVLYVLEVGGVADRTALQMACARQALTVPNRHPKK